MRPPTPVNDTGLGWFPFTVTSPSPSVNYVWWRQWVES